MQGGLIGRPCAESTRNRWDKGGHYETHHVLGTVRGISGWYVHPSDMDWPEGVAWCNYGGVPEIKHDEIHGPFESEAKAWAWVGAVLEDADF